MPATNLSKNTVPAEARLTSFDYGIIRVIPHVERGEFINAGIILYCRTKRFLDAQIELDCKRLATLAPRCDVPYVQEHLVLFPQICSGAGPIGQLEQAERFHWLVAPRSSSIQVSPVHCGLCVDPAAALVHLMEELVRVG